MEKILLKKKRLIKRKIIKKKIIIEKEVVEKLKNNMNINESIVLFNNNKVYHLHNYYGLGDNVFNFILFSQLKNYIETNNIHIYYYAKNEYLYQLKEFIYSENIFLRSLEDKPNNSIELWINYGFFECRHDCQNLPINFNYYYKMFFNKVLNKLNIHLSINRLLYVDNNLIDIYNNIPDKYKKFDILILNSQPSSGQYNYNKDEWDTYIINLVNNGYNVLTTTKVFDLISTADDNLTIKDIAALSTKAQIIIAINSGVVPGLLNNITLLNVKHIYIFDDKCYYSYPNFENKNFINDITFDELNNYIS